MMTCITLLFWVQGLLMLMGSKFLIKLNRLQNTKIKKNSVLCPGHLYQKFDPISHQNQEALSTWKTMFCSEAIMTKTFNLSKAGGLSHSFWFHIFFNKSLLILGCTFLHLGCFGLDTRYTHTYAWNGHPSLPVDLPNGKPTALSILVTAITGYWISSNNSNSQQKPTINNRWTSKSLPGMSWPARMKATTNRICDQIWENSASTHN